MKTRQYPLDSIVELRKMTGAKFGTDESYAVIERLSIETYRIQGRIHGEEVIAHVSNMRPITPELKLLQCPHPGCEGINFHEVWTSTNHTPFMVNLDGQKDFGSTEYDLGQSVHLGYECADCGENVPDWYFDPKLRIAHDKEAIRAAIASLERILSDG